MVFSFYDKKESWYCMLKVVIPETEFFDEALGEFVIRKPSVLLLEHSLLSVSKWEAKWKKPFVNKDKTPEELIDYVRCMTLNKKKDPLVYESIGQDALKTIVDYMEDPMTATTITERNKRRGKSTVITSEVVYSWMVDLGIPFECERWHLNRLIMLIRVCENQGNSGKKMSRKDMMQQNRALNAARKGKYKSHG